MQPIDTSTLRTANHFTYLIYSFRHRLSNSVRLASFRDLKDRWHHWWNRLDDRALATSLDDIFFLLPHVQRVLFPETEGLPAPGSKERVGAARLLAERPLEEVAQRISPRAALRLTYQPKRLEPLQNFLLNYLRSDRGGNVAEEFAAGFVIDWVDAVLFPQRIGLLILKVRLEEAAPSVGKINDFHYYVRAIHPPKLDWQIADWQSTGGRAVMPCKARDVVDYLLQGLTEQPDPRSPSLQAALEHVMHTGETERPTTTPFGQVHGQSFHLYHYSCLAMREPPDWPSGPFDSVVERLLYELATCTDTRKPDYMPAKSLVRSLIDRYRIALWDNWQGMALHDNVVFLGLLEGEFTCASLPHNAEGDYFYLYLLTLFYKNRLSVLSGEMMGREVPLSRRVRLARRISDDFRSFQDDYWFREVTRKPQALELHRRFRDGLGVDPVFDELRQKVAEYQEFHELKLERQVRDLLTVLTFIGIPAGAICSLFGSSLTLPDSWNLFFGVLIGVLVVLWVTWSVWTHRDEIEERYHQVFDEMP